MTHEFIEVVVGSLLGLLFIAGILYFGYALVVTCVALVRLFVKGMIDMLTLRSLRQELQKFRK